MNVSCVQPGEKNACSTVYLILQFFICTAAPGSGYRMLVSADSSKKTHQGSLTRCWTPKQLFEKKEEERNTSDFTAEKDISIE